jgi:hypothetical protein
MSGSHLWIPTVISKTELTLAVITRVQNSSTAKSWQPFLNTSFQYYNSRAAFLMYSIGSSITAIFAAVVCPHCAAEIYSAAFTSKTKF